MARGVDAAWIEQQFQEAPADLVGRTREFLASQSEITPEGLARCASAALAASIGAGADRRGALDLLAADALVTLALAAQVEVDPTRLAEFAASLLSSEARAA